MEISRGNTRTPHISSTKICRKIQGDAWDPSFRPFGRSIPSRFNSFSDLHNVQTGSEPTQPPIQRVKR
jgi:hypothetical protein